MKTLISLSILLLLGMSGSNTIYDFTVTDIDGNPFSFKTLQGKKIMVVNTASKCGFTPQYADLEKLYQQFKDSNFTIIAFPSNDFLKQEPGTDSEIKDFCTVNYGVTFPVMSKIHVKGKKMAPIYKFLTSKEQNGLEDTKVKWNFQKYLINADGTLAKVIYSPTKPTDQEVINWIRK